MATAGALFLDLLSSCTAFLEHVTPKHLSVGFLTNLYSNLMRSNFRSINHQSISIYIAPLLIIPTQWRSWCVAQLYRRAEASSPWGNDAFHPCFRFPLYFRKIFRLHGKFFQFGRFLVIDSKFWISPYFRKIVFSPYFGKITIFPPYFLKFPLIS